MRPTEITLAARGAPGSIARATAWIRSLAHVRVAVLLVLATGALCAFYYLTRADAVGAWTPQRGWAVLSAPPVSVPAHYVLSALVLGVLPVLAARALLGLRWSDMGLGLGERRAGLAVLGVAVPLALIAGWIGAAAPAMRAVYPLDPAVTGDVASFGPYALREFLYYGAWEALFRGVLLFTLARAAGAPLAIAITAALSVTAHFGRPMNETFAAIPGGIVFAIVALRLKSIWYVAVPHWLMAVTMEWLILRR